MPDSKPDLRLDEDGVCSACRSYDERKDVDWNLRRSELLELLARFRNKNGDYWDCVIPVSGGKDSTFQVLQLLELGMNPLCVTATTCDLTPLGRRNIENIKKLGVDLVEFSPNPIVRAKLNRIGLIQVGDISWPEHVGIFTIPVRMALQYRIPLIVWGENSQNEYGGPAVASGSKNLDRRWLEEFGGLLGLRVSDVVGAEGISVRDLLPYIYPAQEELSNLGITGIFLGHFLPWDGLSNVLISQAFGFEVSPISTLGSMVGYENLDNYQTAIHEYFKYLKFGFGRATDHACLHIRRGRITRSMGISISKRLDGAFPDEYLGKRLEDILRPLKLSVTEFIQICDRYTNREIFKIDQEGSIIKDSQGRPIKLNYDNQ